MSFKKNGGFTLVELIVVIAILGILAGIGIPAYGKYVEKTQIAVEEQNINMFHNAYVVACVSNGLDPSAHTPRIRMNAGVFTGLSEIAPRSGDTSLADAAKEFNDFFGFPETSYEFKHLADKVADGIRDGLSGETVKVTYNGKEITVSKELADKLLNTTFSEMGADVLLGKVDTVATIANGLLNFDNAQNPNSIIEKLIFKNSAGEVDGGAEYMKNLAESLNLDLDDPDTAALVSNPNVLANSLVLTAAQKTQGMDTSFLGTDGSVNQLKSELDDPATATDAMAKLALTYGMYTSYVNSEQGKAAGATDKATEVLNSGSLSGMAEVLRSVESDEFRKYLASDEGQADLAAYQASMQIVNDTTKDNPDAAKDILVNGFESDELSGVLNGLMGNTTN